MTTMTSISINHHVTCGELPTVKPAWTEINQSIISMVTNVN